MSDTLLYEHPLNERTRTLLRLSRLFEQIEHYADREERVCSRMAVQALLDILAILARPDIKGELIKQLDQQAKALQKVALNPDVDQVRLQRILNDLGRTADRLHATKGQLGVKLRRNEFLSAISQRLTIPGGSFEFDLPQFHFWLHQPGEVRRRDLRAWLEELSVVRDTTDLVLGLLRNASLMRQVTARQGLYQKSLDSQRPVELIQVALDANLRLFPEISGSRHRFTIRFMSVEESEQPAAVDGNVIFGLKLCLF